MRSRKCHPCLHGEPCLLDKGPPVGVTPFRLAANRGPAGQLKQDGAPVPAGKWAGGHSSWETVLLMKIPAREQDFRACSNACWELPEITENCKAERSPVKVLTVGSKLCSEGSQLSCRRLEAARSSSQTPGRDEFQAP